MRKNETCNQCVKGLSRRAPRATPPPRVIWKVKVTKIGAVHSARLQFETGTWWSPRYIFQWKEPTHWGGIPNPIFAASAGSTTRSTSVHRVALFWSELHAWHHVHCSLDVDVGDHAIERALGVVNLKERSLTALSSRWSMKHLERCANVRFLDHAQRRRYLVASRSS